MYNIEIILTAIVAILVRIYIQKGSFTLPTMYKEGNNVRFNWGSLGVLVVGILTVFLGGFLDPALLTGPVTTANIVTTFSLVYTLPALSDAIVTKALPGKDEDNQIIPLEIDEQEFSEECA